MVLQQQYNVQLDLEQVQLLQLQIMMVIETMFLQVGLQHTEALLEQHIYI